MKSNMKNRIKDLSSKIFDDTVNNRRHLHMNPELSFKEFNTSKFIWDKLDEIGITDKKKLADTGINLSIAGVIAHNTIEEFSEIEMKWGGDPSVLPEVRVVVNLEDTRQYKVDGENPAIPWDISLVVKVLHLF